MLDLEAAGISSVVWTTGVKGEFGWLPAATVGPYGGLIQTDGISPLPCLYFVGLPWQRNRASGIIRGLDADAAFIAKRMAA